MLNETDRLERGPPVSVMRAGMGVVVGVGVVVGMGVVVGVATGATCWNIHGTAPVGCWNIME